MARAPEEESGLRGLPSPPQAEWAALGTNEVVAGTSPMGDEMTSLALRLGAKESKGVREAGTQFAPARAPGRVTTQVITMHTSTDTNISSQSLLLQSGGIQSGVGMDQWPNRPLRGAAFESQSSALSSASSQQLMEQQIDHRRASNVTSSTLVSQQQQSSSYYQTDSQGSRSTTYRVMSDRMMYEQRNFTRAPPSVTVMDEQQARLPLPAASVAEEEDAGASPAHMRVPLACEQSEIALPCVRGKGDGLTDLWGRGRVICCRVPRLVLQVGQVVSAASAAFSTVLKPHTSEKLGPECVERNRYVVVHVQRVLAPAQQLRG
jgi:hypothetical protein